MKQTRDYPQYRKFPHDRTFFKIIGPDRFVQLEIIGDRYELQEIIAGQYPEKQRINAMLNTENEHWLEIDEQDYEERLSYCQTSLNPI